MGYDVNKTGVLVLENPESFEKPEEVDTTPIEFAAEAPGANIGDVTIGEIGQLRDRLLAAIHELNAGSRMLAALQLPFPEQLTAVGVQGLNLFNMQIGAQQPAGGAAGDVFIDVSNAGSGDAVRATASNGNGFVEGQSALELALQPFINRIMSLEAGQLDGQALQNSLTAIEAVNSQINLDLSGKLDESMFTVADLVGTAQYTLADFHISDARTASQITQEIDQAKIDIRGVVPVEGNTLAKLLSLIVAERSRITAEVARGDEDRARLDGVLAGSVAEFDSLLEVLNRVLSGEAEDDAALAALNSAIAGRMASTQSALIEVINTAGGNKGAIRVALDVVSSAQLSGEVAAINTALGQYATQAAFDVAVAALVADIAQKADATALAGKQDTLTGLQGQRIGFDQDGNPIAEDVPAADNQTILPRDFALDHMFAPHRAMVRHEYVVIADGAGSVAQSFAKHPFTGDRYSINRIGATDNHVIVKHGPDGPIRLQVQDRSVVSDRIAHQGFFFVPSKTTPADPYIIMSAGYGEPGSENSICRTRFRAGPTAMSFEYVDVFNDGAGRGSTSPSMSPSGNFICVRDRSEVGVVNTIKVYLTETLMDAFDNSDRDQTASHIAEFSMPEGLFPADVLPIQSHLIDDNLVYVFMGFGDTRGPLARAVFNWRTGALVSSDTDWQFAADRAQLAERSAADVAAGVAPREVESARWAWHCGRLVPEISVGVGSSGARTNLIYLMDVGAEHERDQDQWFDTLSVKGSSSPQEFEIEFSRQGNVITGQMNLTGIDADLVTQANLELTGLKYGAVDIATFPVITSRYDRPLDLTGVVNGSGAVTEIEFREVLQPTDDPSFQFQSGIYDAVNTDANPARYIRGTIVYKTDFRSGT